ncbi:MAG: hypothetical protein WA005_15090, partial [Candidatus Binataceae bacterium]
MLLGLLGGLSGCVVPRYGGYGASYPAAGYAPYSYGFPLFARPYAPGFAEHRPWEEHHAYGHPTNFFHGGGPGGGFPGGGGPGGGGHGGGGPGGGGNGG